VPSPSGKSVRHHLKAAFRRRLGEHSPETELMRELERESAYMAATPDQRRTVRAVVMQTIRDLDKASTR
jgi:hypothetical protein